MAERADGAESDGDRRLPGRLGRVVRWLRELHRGYAYTGHLPRRRR